MSVINTNVSATIATNALIKKRASDEHGDGAACRLA